MSYEIDREPTTLRFPVQMSADDAADIISATDLYLVPGKSPNDLAAAINAQCQRANAALWWREIPTPKMRAEKMREAAEAARNLLNVIAVLDERTLPAIAKTQPYLVHDIAKGDANAREAELVTRAISEQVDDLGEVDMRDPLDVSYFIHQLYAFAVATENSPVDKIEDPIFDRRSGRDAKTRLIGEWLPKVYTEMFGKACGKGAPTEKDNVWQPTGPGPRFIHATLEKIGHWTEARAIQKAQLVCERDQKERAALRKAKPPHPLPPSVNSGDR
ncbi:MAG: hypothetical protein R8J41_00420 [Alphaproteobacteria bacterium]|nr:hypothetical protein [Alphaproteobacteria bacterium]